MKVCIIYDTKRGSTRQIARWMMEELEDLDNVKAEMKKPSEISGFGHDLFIIGSPIYWEKPMKSVVDFLSSNQNNFKDKKVAIFVVCIAEIFGKGTEKYIKNHYLKPLEEKVSGSLIKSKNFKGWMRKPDCKQEKNVKEWTRGVIKECSF